MVRQTIIFWIKPTREQKIWVKYVCEADKLMNSYQADNAMELLMEDQLFNKHPYNEDFQVYSITKNESDPVGWEYIKSPIKRNKKKETTKLEDKYIKKEQIKKFQYSGLIDRDGNVYYCGFAEHHKLIKELHLEGKIHTTYYRDEDNISDQIYDLYGWIDDNGWVKFSMGSFHFGNGSNGLYQYHSYEYGLTENQIKTILYLLVSSDDYAITINGENFTIQDFFKKVDTNRYSIINNPSKRLDKNRIGNKAYNLCLLKNSGVNVPDFIIIPNETCIKILKEEVIKENFLENIILPDSVFYSVRSSAPISMPGMLDTHLFVKKEELIEKILLVINSWKNKRAKDYRKMMNIPEDCQISVIIQKMIDSTKDENSGSGVLICEDYKIINGEFLHKQSGLGLVNGTINPIDISKIPFNIKKKLKKQIEIINSISNIPQEVEFSYESGNVFILQIRDYIDTCKKEHLINVDEFVLIGVGKRGCDGIVIGRAVFDEFDIENIDGDKIYVAFHTSVEEVYNMSKCKGVISSIGGSLSHAAITARHLNIPCVTGSKFKIINKVAYFDKCEIRVGDIICVDGNNGNIFKV